LEWAQVYDNFYGTSREHVEQILAQGKHAILDVDTQGALAIQQGYQGAVLVFIAPPSLEDLESRLRGRGTEDEASLHKRLSKAEHEISFSGRYDFKIINDDLDKAVEAFFSILTQVGEQNVEFTKLDINPTETLAVTTEKAVQYALEKMGQEELVRSLKKEVKTALVLEIEELIRDRLAKAINNDLSDIVAETYRVYKTL
ncbi:MAG: hypothetical protein OEZ59_05175, partial [Deltaproteobacteria bacterium]|nr:hypothetical protein [Deltaproteobacteria bacterium]